MSSTERVVTMKVEIKTGVKEEIPDDDYSEQSGKFRLISFQYLFFKIIFMNSWICFLIVTENGVQYFDYQMDIGEEFKTEPVNSESTQTDHSEVKTRKLI